MAERKFRTAIPDAEWEVTLQLTQGPDNHKVGEAVVLHFADSYVAKDFPRGVTPTDWLVARRIEEMVPALKKKAAAEKRKKKA